MKMMKFNLHSR